MADELSSEQQFIHRLIQRDERAFNELVEAYGGRVFRLVFRMLGRRDGHLYDPGGDLYQGMQILCGKDRKALSRG